MATIPDALNLALRHHQAGRLQEAEAIYRQILQANPNHQDALHLLGVIAHQSGRNDVAIELITKAIALDSSKPEYHNNLGNALQERGDLDAAVVCLRQAVALHPGYAEAHANLANALVRQDKLDEAVTSFRRALALRPDFADAHYNLGNTLQKQGMLKEAVASYEKAVSIKPDLILAHVNLGDVLQEQGSLAEAIASYLRALALKPDFADAYHNLGNALKAQGKPAEAVACYRQALALKPDCGAIHQSLGIALQEQGELKAAVASYRRALAVDPNDAKLHGNLATTLLYQGYQKEAEASYRRAMAIDPDHAGVHSAFLFNLSYNTTDPKVLAREYRKWNERHARPLAAGIRPHTNDRDPERRLRVGYLSADFWSHAVSHFFEPLLLAHDRARVEVFCYSNAVRVDAATQNLQQSADVWRNIVGMSDEAVAERVSADAIDILVDLTGHAAGKRLLVFARKPAPVQVTYLGSLSTTGLAAMDYRLSDRFLTPADTTEWFSEKLIRLPGCFACYRPLVYAPEVAPLPAMANGYVTFGSFNNLTKVTPNVVALWSEILRLVPKARLILKDVTLVDAAQRRHYHELFASCGIESERIELLPRTPPADYLAMYGRIDIGLDPFPYNGCTTTCEALWMGVPVITLAGSVSYGRFGVSLLSTLELPEFIAATPEEYVKKAVNWAKNRKRMATLRTQLRAKMAASALCDAKAFAPGVEQAYRLMWRRWCKSQK